MGSASGSVTKQDTADILARYESDPFLLLPILQEFQDRFHFVPPQAKEAIARHLSLPLSHVEGVVGFYHFLSDEPRGEYEILLSDCIIDHFRGRESIRQRLCDQFSTRTESAQADARVSIRQTACTGLCDQGPAALVNGYAIAALDVQRVEQMVALIRCHIPVNQWPETLFQIESNIRLPGPLLYADLVPGKALERAFQETPEALLTRLERSGLRGRGGAGFPTGMKWRLCRETPGEHYLVCNADEGEPGTFKDRELLRHHAHAVLEGMTLGAWVTGAAEGYLYLRGEYRFLRPVLEQTLRERRKAGLLGEDIGGMKGFDFDITIRLGAGAYICGEESALLESLQGNRPRPRNRPPFPVTHGLRGQPTLVNNVETFAAVTFIALHGSEWLRNDGTETSPGSKLLSISGDCSRPGIYEFPFGTSIHEILDTCGAQSPMGVQVGGPSGNFITPREFTRRLAFDDLSTGGSFMIFNGERDLLEVIENFTRFFARESCGFCTPCRVGTSLQERLIKDLRQGKMRKEELPTLQQLGRIMATASHCGLGKTAANPVMTTLEKAPQYYQRAFVQTGSGTTAQPCPMENPE